MPKGKPRGDGKFSPRRVEAAQKHRQAVELRMAGRTYDEIAKALDYKDRTGALYAVRTALEKANDETVDQWKALTIERLNKIIQVFWPMMINVDQSKDFDTRLAAAEECRKVIKDLRRLDY